VILDHQCSDIICSGYIPHKYIPHGSVLPTQSHSDFGKNEFTKLHFL